MVVGLLHYLATHISATPTYLQYVLWPTFWALQGGVGTGLWVIAHECGHRAFSDSVLVCDVVGWILHSLLLVPYHSWRISHAKHHRSTGDLKRDEVFLPRTVSSLKDQKAVAYQAPGPLGLVKIVAETIGMFLVGWYLYLGFHMAGRDYGKTTNHYDPRSPLFNAGQFWMVVISDIGVLAVLAGAAGVAWHSGWWTVAAYFAIPLMVTNFWLLLYTFLHHTDPALPHYRTEEWNWLQGALATVDRDYGVFFNTMHHDIGSTHVLHHLFSMIPHYHAKEASEAIKPVLGKYYYQNPQGIAQSLWEVITTCRYVDDLTTERAVWFTGKGAKSM